MGFIISGLIAFAALVIYLVAEKLLDEKDAIINSYEDKNQELMDELIKLKELDYGHKLWLTDVAHITNINKIKSLLLNYAKPVAPKAKTKDNTHNTTP